MRRVALALVVLAAVAATTACGLDPKPRTLPAGFASPRFLLVSDEAQGPLLVGGDYGLRYSLDGGRTWRAPTDADEPAVAAAPYRTSLLVSRGLTGQVYPYALTGTAEPRVPWPFAGAVTLLAGNARLWRLWAVVVDGERRLLYSNDGGQRWWSMPAVGLCAKPRALAAGAVGPTGAERLWAACGRRGLLVSDDLGASFTPVPGISNALGVVASRTAVNRLIVLTPNVLATRDGGRTWTISGTQAAAVAIDPRNPDLVFAATTDGRLLASLDGGRSF